MTLKRSAPIKRAGFKRTIRKQMRAQSIKTRREAAARRAAKATVIAEAGGQCQLADFACAGPLDFHHVRKAGAGGAYVVANGLALCRFHNDDLENRPWLYDGTSVVVREGDPGWNELGRRYAREGGAS